MSVYNQVVLSPDPLYLQPKSYDARADRKWFADFISTGRVSSGDFAVTYSGSALGLSVAGGVAYVLGGNISDQGMYRQYTSSTSSVSCPAAHASLPRIDTVILRVMDTAADASGYSEARIEVVPGTATSGATLANLSGVNPLTSLGEASQSFIKLAYILVPAAATTLTNTATNVLDARTYATVGGGLATINGVPTGASIEWIYSASQIPTGFVLGYGQAISRTTYSGLNTLAAGATPAYPHGNGDGSTTFNMIDYRGRVGVGLDNMGGSAANRVTSASITNPTTLGSAGGAETHTLTSGEMPSHTHTGTTNTVGNHAGHNYDDGSWGSGTGGATRFPDHADGQHNHSFTSDATGSGGAHTNMIPSIMVNRIIKT